MPVHPAEERATGSMCSPFSFELILYVPPLAIMLTTDIR